MQCESAGRTGLPRDFHLGLALVDGRHLEFAAQRSRHHRNRHPAVQVGAIALEELMGGERQENVEIAGGPAADAGLALAGQPDAVPSSTPCGILTDRFRSRVTRPEPTQDGQGSSMVWPRPWQPGQVRSRVKNPCACRTRPAPPQVEHAFGLVPALAPMPEQDSQVTETGISIWAVLPRKASSSVISIL